MLPHRVPSGSNSPLSGFVEGFLNGVFVDPAKIWPELLKVNVLSCDSMFVLSNVGDVRGMGEGMVNSPIKLANSSILRSCAPCWKGFGAHVGSPDVVGNRKISMILPLVSCCNCVNNPSSS